MKFYRIIEWNTFTRVTVFNSKDIIAVRKELSKCNLDLNAIQILKAFCIAIYNKGYNDGCFDSSNQDEFNREIFNSLKGMLKRM